MSTDNGGGDTADDQQDDMMPRGHAAVNFHSSDDDDDDDEDDDTFKAFCRCSSVATGSRNSSLDKSSSNCIVRCSNNCSVFQ